MKVNEWPVLWPAFVGWTWAFSFGLVLNRHIPPWAYTLIMVLVPVVLTARFGVANMRWSSIRGWTAECAR